MPRTFREATDLLGLSMEELADALGGISKQSVKQARLDPSASGYRSPPSGWETVVAKLARERGGELERLAEDLEEADRVERAG